MADQTFIGQFNSTPPTVASGNSVPLQVDASGNLKATLVQGNAVLSATNPLPVTVGSNTNVSLLSSTTLSASGSISDISNLYYRGVQLVVNVTAFSGTSPTLVITIQGRDTLSGNYYNILASAIINAVGVYRMTVYPGISNSPNAAQSDVLSATWRVSYTLGGSNPSFTLSIGASLQL